ncbi:MAG: 2-C-methyl-D-erythritol 4-phosphate cytidylyltransferase [Agathobacter sp.]|nr:2-C-methyl-D-erythritol 4-phosphate cytidylyltransferase [Lachnospiraceae bacterium]MBR3811062.1 2-C-methyl-D-erythritol 4-phosphate cytidylyltransferase [Agathobacter sp.]MBR4059092.1 2-C-methyl-D-erythritol 4-phosphate cytidylyltransferase [Lachnospiraceae bacterium]
MIFGAILAGGVGSRMKMSDMPKQFLLLGYKPIVIHTLEKFLLNTRMDKVYVGVHPDWLDYMEDLIEKYIVFRKEDIVCVAGGGDRNSTIMNIVDAIEAEFGENEDDYIITHDSVRPFVTARILDENIECVIKYNACDTVIPATDTIVEAKDNIIISDIPERKYMYQGQTPQSFKIGLLKKLFRELSEEEKGILTDACKICLMRGVPVHLVEGEVSNLKITTVTDYKIAQALIGGVLSD